MEILKDGPGRSGPILNVMLTHQPFWVIVHVKLINHMESESRVHLLENLCPTENLRMASQLKSRVDRMGDTDRLLTTESRVANGAWDAKEIHQHALVVPSFLLTAGHQTQILTMLSNFVCRLA
jgi:hypothetical protein